jgi:hypothetical protein
VTKISWNEGRIQNPKSQAQETKWWQELEGFFSYFKGNWFHQKLLKMFSNVFVSTPLKTVPTLEWSQEWRTKNKKETQDPFHQHNYREWLPWDKERDLIRSIKEKGTSTKERLKIEGGLRHERSSLCRKYLLIWGNTARDKEKRIDFSHLFDVSCLDWWSCIWLLNWLQHRFLRKSLTKPLNRARGMKTRDTSYWLRGKSMTRPLSRSGSLSIEVLLKKRRETT